MESSVTTTNSMPIGEPKNTRSHSLEEKGTTTNMALQANGCVGGGSPDGDVSPSQPHPLDENIMKQQATINLITMGHVAHGKSTLMKVLTGVSTGRHLDEMKQNMTIHLGYANVKIFKCTNPKCPPPGCYKNYPSKKKKAFCDVCPGNNPMKLIRHFSFVDAPGHQNFMSTMISGTCIVDGALLLVAANQECPMPQTSEHVAVARLMNIIQNENIVVLQNKVDLCTKEQVLANKREIDRFVYRSGLPEDAPVLPICAQRGHNIDVLLEYMVNRIPVPVRSISDPARMTLIRSFDVNKPGFSWRDLKGGVVGGTLSQGSLKVGQTVEIRPGFVFKDGTVQPILTTVTSIQSEQTRLDSVIPGGLIALGTTVDPQLTKANLMVGHVVGEPGTLPDVFRRMRVKYTLTKYGTRRHKRPKKGEMLSLNINSMRTRALVENTPGPDVLELKLEKTCCAEYYTKVAISRQVASEGSEQRWQLIGAGQIRAIVKSKLRDVQN